MANLKVLISEKTAIKLQMLTAFSLVFLCAIYSLVLSEPSWLFAIYIVCVGLLFGIIGLSKHSNDSNRYKVLCSIIIMNVTAPLCMLLCCPLYIAASVLIIGTVEDAFVLERRPAIVISFTGVAETVLVELLSKGLQFDTVVFMIFMICLVSLSFVLTSTVRRCFNDVLDEVSVDNEYLEMNNETLKVTNSIDKLTGLFNRAYYDIEIKKATECAAKGSPVSLMMLDIDHFKAVNDTFGHDAGDLALRSLALLIKDNIRENDIACRYGGEEFVIIMYCDVEIAARRAEQIRKVVEVEQIPVVGNITVSIGVAGYLEGMDSEAFFKLADKMVYDAKESGRNQVKVLRKRSYGHLYVID